MYKFHLLKIHTTNRNKNSKYLPEMKWLPQTFCREICSYDQLFQSSRFNARIHSLRRLCSMGVFLEGILKKGIDLFFPSRRFWQLTAQQLSGISSACVRVCIRPLERKRNRPASACPYARAFINNNNNASGL